MPQYSAQSKSYLDNPKMHPDLRTLFYEVIKKRDCKILDSTIRTVEMQKEYVAKGLSKTMQSNHLPQADGFIHAVDAQCYPINFNDEKSQIYFAGYVMAVADRLYAEGKMTHKLRYGGDWDGNTKITDGKPNDSFSDLQHFELI